MTNGKRKRRAKARDRGKARAVRKPPGRKRIQFRMTSEPSSSPHAKQRNVPSVSGGVDSDGDSVREATAPAHKARAPTSGTFAGEPTSVDCGWVGSRLIPQGLPIATGLYIVL